MSTSDQSTQALASSAAPAAPLTWALCVATLNRIDMLETCVTCALAQTRPPSEVIIVDASDDWQTHRQRISALTSQADVPTVYIAAHRLSSSSQRNQGIAATSADILFLIDDDALLHPDAAREVMRIYSDDIEQRIAALELSSSLDRPSATNLAASDMSSAIETRKSLESVALASRFRRFLWHDVLMMSNDRNFVPWNGPIWKKHHRDLELRPINGVVPASYLGGFALTVRRTVALAEPFDEGLLSYAVAEDRDASYRFMLHGANVHATNANLYHAETQVARLKRFQVVALSILNIAYLTKKHSQAPVRDLSFMTIIWLRRCLAELIKDAVRGRLSFPQFRAALYAGLLLPRLYTRAQGDLQPWYEAIQSKLLWGTRIAPPGPGNPSASSSKVTP